MKHVSYLKHTNNNRFYIIISACLIITFVIKLAYTAIKYFIDLGSSFSDVNPLNSFEYSEFLINFQGGFVRRGLFGEILYQIYSLANYPLIPVLTVICYLFFIFVCVFFFQQFRKRKYCWWILLSPLFLGFTTYIVRKDYILYSILIGCLYLIRNGSLNVNNRLLSCVLITLGLFLHEAFILWGFPIYALLLLSYHKDRALNYILISVPIVSFMILSLYKGTTETANAIVDSWNSLLYGAPLINTTGNSIGALGWDSIDTFCYHLRRNINTLDGGYGIVLLPVYIVSAYYMFTNFLQVFSNKTDSTRDNDKLTISLLYSSVLFCLIPMFTILSCDTGRVFQYASVTAFSTFLIIPHDVIISAFPKWYVDVVQRCNAAMVRFLPPSKGLIILMLLFIGMSPCHFSIQTCWEHSVIGSLFEAFIRGIKLSICLIH